MTLTRKLAAALKGHGVLRTGILALQRVRLTLGIAWEQVRALVFDLAHGVETRGLEGVRRDSDEQGFGYQSTPSRFFHRVVGRLPIAHGSFTFIDLGCGKGATLLFAGSYPFRRIVGVELVSGLAEVARRNVERARRIPNRSVMEVVAASALSYVFPPEPTLLYLYNPFPSRPMGQMLANVEQSLRETPRPFVIVYCHPVSRVLFDRLPWLSEVGSGHRGRIAYVVYANEAGLDALGAGVRTDGS